MMERVCPLVSAYVRAGLAMVERVGRVTRQYPHFTQLNRAPSLKVGLDGDQVVRATGAGTKTESKS